jgi:uncharacterized protein YbcI
MSSITHDGAPSDRVTARISDEIVRLLAASTGHGATRAWTTLGDDLIVCVLQDVLSKGEQNLVRSGERETVLKTRSAYQAMMETDAVAAVEALSGRSVRAFTSANHLDEDLAVEIFVLEPELETARDGAAPASAPARAVRRARTPRRRGSA